jgi:hypothetical protein
VTHDELLAKINALEETIHRELSNTLILGSATPFQALRAVVEVTKTELNTATDDFNEGWHLAMCRILYVIEKELK